LSISVIYMHDMLLFIYCRAMNVWEHFMLQGQLSMVSINSCSLNQSI